MQRSSAFLKVQKRAAEVRQAYSERATDYANILVYGPFGTGKTRLALTAPKPVFIDSFDPGGTKTRDLQPLIEAGDVIVEAKWESDKWKEPWAFREWEAEMRSRANDGFFNHLGTYILDSTTRWSKSLMYAVLQTGDRKGGPRKGETPQIQDYLTQQLTAIDWLGEMMTYHCHVVVTGHIARIRDEVRGQMETGLLLWGKLSEEVPLVFDEKYVARCPAEGSYVLQTKNDGYYAAETRMGGGIFAAQEAQDLRRLLKLAGKRWEDKPSLFDTPSEETDNGQSSESPP